MKSRFLREMFGPWIVLFILAVFMQEYALRLAGVTGNSTTYWLDFAALVCASQAGRVDIKWSNLLDKQDELEAAVEASRKANDKTV